MGRIKSKMIKNTAKELIKREDSFTDKFEDNKKILKNTMPSKSVRNKIAGYMARVIKMKKNPRVVKQKEPEEVQAMQY